MPSLLPVAERLAPVGLAELVAAADLQDRVDRKYVVGLDVLHDALEALAATHRVLEIDGVRRFAYATTYHDSAGLRTFRDHLQGRRRRFKCRVRHYADTDTRSFEVKTKGARGRTIKHRRECAPGEEHALAPASLAFAREVVREAYGRVLAEPLAPTLAMSYHRVTLADLGHGARLTCDLDLRFAGPDGATGALADGLAVVETKSARGSSAADRVLRDLGARPVRTLSKYCVGVALTHEDVRANRLLPHLRRWFVTGEAQPGSPTPLALAA
jgi:hypothetical protein